MLNYDEIVIQANEHRNLLLTNATQQRLAQAQTVSQAHSLIDWIGRRLIQWGQLLQDETPRAPLVTPSMPFTR